MEEVCELRKRKGYSEIDPIMMALSAIILLLACILTVNMNIQDQNKEIISKLEIIANK